MDNFIANSRFIPDQEKIITASCASLPDDNEIDPFTTKFFIRMIRLEELTNTRELNEKILNELLSYYAKCVEHYDIEKDAIKYYFIEKIQSIISSKRTLQMILNKKNSNYEENKDASLLEKRIEASKEEISSDEDSLQNNEKENSLNSKFIKHRKERLKMMKSAKKKIGKLNFVSISSKKIERAKKMNIFIKAQENKHEIDVNSKLDDFQNNTEKNNNLVKEDFDSQTSYVKLKIEQKKKMMEALLLKKQNEKSEILPRFYSMASIQHRGSLNTDNRFSPLKNKSPGIRQSPLKRLVEEDLELRKDS